MTARPRVGLLGGTFDPIHSGHLAAARAAEKALALDAVRFILSARPPHRTDSPRASEYHRMEMVRLAIAEATVGGRGPHWEVSDQEVRRPGQSYTVDTLAAFGSEGLTPLQMFFVIGADAFAEISSWHRYPEVLDAAHFVVVTRPGTPVRELRDRVPALASRLRSVDDPAATTTVVYLVEADTPEVSSTDIRRRISRNESIAGLVPASVAAYISQHHLYRAAPDAPVAPDPPVAPGR